MAILAASSRKSHAPPIVSSQNVTFSRAVRDPRRYFQRRASCVVYVTTSRRYSHRCDTDSCRLGSILWATEIPEKDFQVLFSVISVVSVVQISVSFQLMDIRIRFDRHGFVVLENDTGIVFSADTEGRIISVWTPEVSLRRSRLNRWYRTIRKPWPSLEEVPESELEEISQRWGPVWYEAIMHSHRQEEPNAEKLLQRWIDDFRGYHERDAAAFEKVYGKISIVPPDAYQMLYVRVSRGCPWNRCTFCTFYQDQPYHTLNLDELEQHLAEVRGYWRSALSSRLGIFLGDANALATPAAALGDRLERIQEAFPEFREFDSFVDYFSGTKRTVQDFYYLKLRGLRRISLGVESGCETLMDFVQKPVPAEDIVRLAAAARSSGLSFNAIFLVGLGGRNWIQKHFEDSMDLIHRMQLVKGDRIYLSPLVTHNTGNHPGSRAESMEPAEIHHELLRWKHALSVSAPEIQASIYNIEHFAC